ncbi:MAG: hypothetical protein AAF532_14230 [Planctomycetota bacterium]
MERLIDRLGDSLGFKRVGTNELRSLAEFEQWADGSKVRFRGRVPAARFASDAGVVLGGADGPLLVSRRFGFGRVSVFGPDLNAAPLKAWRDRDALIEKAALLGRPELPSSLQVANAASLDGSIGGQLDRALATFDVEELPRANVYVGLILLAVLFGPLEYLLVHKVFKRPKLTWATLPLLCVASWYALTASGTASTNVAGGPRAKSVTLVDEVVAADGGLPNVPPVVSRSRTLFAMASDRHARFDLRVTDAAAGPGPVAIGWHAPPGEQFGGRDRPGRLDPSAPEYVVDAAERTVAAWPIPAGGAKMLRILGSVGTPPAASLAGRLSSPGSRLRGTLVNTTDQDLVDCRLIYGGRVYWPNLDGLLPAGETWDLEAAETGGATRTRYLRRSQVTMVDVGSSSSRNEKLASEAARLRETDYDARGRNVSRIVEVLSLYRAAGGPDYTGLTDAGTENDDLSLWLEEGYAVFLGRVAAPAAPLEVDGLAADRFDATTIRRVVLPVTAAGSSVDRDLPELDPNKRDKDAG